MRPLVLPVWSVRLTQLRPPPLIAFGYHKPGLTGIGPAKAACMAVLAEGTATDGGTVLNVPGHLQNPGYIKFEPTPAA